MKHQSDANQRRDKRQITGKEKQHFTERRVANRENFQRYGGRPAVGPPLFDGGVGQNNFRVQT
jgi:hypothetical protein